MTRAKDAALHSIAELDHAELTIRLLEIGCKMKRPPNATGQDALAEMRQKVRDGKVPAYIVQDFEDMATAALEYMRECVNNIRTVQ